MRRRKLLTQASLTLSTASLLVSCNQTTQTATTTPSSLPQVRWRMVTSWPKSLDTIFGSAENIGKRLEELTGGNFRIQAYAAGEIVPALGVMDAV